MCCIIWDLVSTMTEARDWIIQDRIPARGTRFCRKCPDLLCSRGTGAPSPSSKWTICEGHHSSASRAEVRNDWSYTSHLPLCPCGMHRDSSTFLCFKHITLPSVLIGTACTVWALRLPAKWWQLNHHSMLTFCDVLHAPLLLLALLGTHQHSRIPPKSNNINSYLHEPRWSGPNLCKCFMKKDKTRQDNLMPKLCSSCTTITIQTAINVRFQSSGMWYWVIGQVFPATSEDHSAFIFRV